MTAQHPVGELIVPREAGFVGRALVPADARRSRGRITLVGVLLLCDGFAIAGAFALAYVLRFKTQIGLFYLPPNSPLLFYSSLIFWLVPLVLATLAAYGLYRLDHLFTGNDEYARVASASTLALILVVLVSFVFDDRLVISRAWMIISWIALIVCVSAGRFAVRRLVYRLRRAGRLTRPVLVLGGGVDAAELAARLRETPACGLAIVGIYDPRHLCEPTGDGQATALRRLIRQLDVEAVIVCAASVAQESLDTIVRELASLPTELHLIPGMHDILTTGVRVREIRGLPLVTMNKVRITGIDQAMKRFLDCAVSAAVLVALAPLLLSVALAIRLGSPGPVFHRRRVVGQSGRTFAALKFRTMYADGDAILARHPDLQERLRREGKLADDPRVTPGGRWLRRWSIDELPQLVNVLRGQMSLVGPRMISEAEQAHFGRWRENLFTVKPGLTGLWQVSGRSNLGYEDRVRLDMHYIRGYTVWSDIEILLRTIPTVLFGVGAY